MSSKTGSAHILSRSQDDPCLAPGHWTEKALRSKITMIYKFAPDGEGWDLSTNKHSSGKRAQTVFMFRQRATVENISKILIQVVFGLYLGL